MAVGSPEMMKKAEDLGLGEYKDYFAGIIGEDDDVMDHKKLWKTLGRTRAIDKGKAVFLVDGEYQVESPAQNKIRMASYELDKPIIPSILNDNDEDETTPKGPSL